jgi:hypothetical protein
MCPLSQNIVDREINALSAKLMLCSHRFNPEKSVDSVVRREAALSWLCGHLGREIKNAQKARDTALHALVVWNGGFCALCRRFRFS